MKETEPMNNPKHTPGPWRLASYSNCDGFAVFSESDPMFGCITERWEDEPDPERMAKMKANAEYIVRACNSYPDLVNALKRCLPEWVHTENYADIPDHKIAAELTMGDLRAILAAIANAQPEGEQ